MFYGLVDTTWNTFITLKNRLKRFVRKHQMAEGTQWPLLYWKVYLIV